MTEIGGYFELELRKGKHYHANALRLNTARNCFEYILRVRKYTHVYIPYFTCEVILEPLIRLNISYSFYHINEKLEPFEIIQLKVNEAFLYTNYFGLKQNTIEYLRMIYGNFLIVDNSQAFFETPFVGIDTFYSARKYFGVPDGAYLYIDKYLDLDLEKDISYDRMAHLLVRLDLGAERGYPFFQKNDNLFSDVPIRKMSRLTEMFLCSIDYESVRQKRRENYFYLHSHLCAKNNIEFDISISCAPMIYPFLSNNIDIRKSLLSNKIYVATYWPNVLKWCNNDSVDYILAEKMLPLPIDQRYGIEDMEMIINTID